MTKKPLTWDLSALYRSLDDPAIEADFSQIDTIIATLQPYRGRIKRLSMRDLLSLIQNWEKCHILLDKISLFAGLLQSTHIGQASYTRFVKEIERRSVERTKALLFIETEFANLPELTWQKILRSPHLIRYQKLMSDLYHQAKHTLTEPEEKILAEKDQVARQGFIHLFEMTTDTLTFNWDGQSISLEELLSHFHNPDPDTRRRAAEELYRGLSTNDKTTPAILNALMQNKSIDDRLRRYQTPQEARLMRDSVEPESVEAMIQAVTAQWDMIRRYYTIKKEILKAKELYWWDRYAPLPESTSSIEIPAAKAMVLSAYKEFSSEIAAIVSRLFDTQHIDWLPSQSKGGGAFCANAGRSADPYILLNYTKQPRDVMTLAHELGHAIHDVLANSHNVYFQVHPSLALAEIASVFGEMLLHEKLTADARIRRQDKMGLLMAFIEDRFATIFRQVAMFQFEQHLHEKRLRVGELSKDEIDSLWDETMKAPFARALTYTKEHRNSWMYVGHIFQMPFYVYSYAFAQLCVLSLYKRYKDEGASFVPIYLDVLRRGGSMSPKDNLALAGLDITETLFWQQGLSVLDGHIAELDSMR